MTEIPENLYSLDDFRKEIAAIVKEEEAAKKEGEVHSGHFLNFDFSAEELTTEDMEIWQKIKSGNVTLEEVKEYDRKFRESSEPGALSNTSRGLFVQFAGNMANVSIFRREQKLKA